MPVVQRPITKSVFKSRGESSTLDATYVNTSNYVGNSSGSYGSRIAQYSVMETSGARIPNYFRRVADGELLPHTSFRQFVGEGEAWGSMNRYQINSGTGQWQRNIINNFIASTASIGTRSYNGVSVALPYYFMPENVLDNSVDKTLLPGLIQEAQSKAYSEGHDTLTFLAELHKLRDMWKSRAEKLLSLPKVTGSILSSSGVNPKKGRGARRRADHTTENYVKSQPGNWLEWRYGWRTALFDIQSLSDALVNIHDNRKRVSQRAGFSSRNVVQSYGTESDSSINLYSYTVTTETEVSYRGNVTADFVPPRFAINPVTTAWELLPYSFIIDWFLSVGAWLNSLSFVALSGDFVTSGGYQVTTKETLDRQVHSWNKVANFQFSGIRELFYETNSTLQVRIPMSASYLPTTRLKLDGLKVIDLLSILWQRVR